MAWTPRSFTTRSNIQLPSDEFEAEVEETAFGSLGGAITLEAGYVDQDGQPHTVAVGGGTITENVGVVRKDSAVLTVRGSTALDNPLFKIYQMRFLVPPVDPAALAVEPGGVNDPTSPAYIPYTIGTFTAKKIAAMAGCGAWSAQDYTMRADFTANGRLIDILNQLVAPFQMAEATKSDIFVYGGMVVVQQRGTRAAQAMAMNSFSAKDARLNNLEMRVKRGQFFRHIVLYGMPIMSTASSGASGQGPEPFVYIEGETNADTTQTIITDEVTTTISEHIVYRTPEMVVKQVTRRTSTNSGLVSTEDTVNTWELASTYSYKLPDPPRLKQTVTTVQGYAPNDKQKMFRVLKSITVGYEYDGNGFLKNTVTKTSEWDSKTGKMKTTTLSVSAVRDSGKLQVSRDTIDFKLNSKDNTWNVSGAPDTSLSAGYRPGGPLQAGGAMFGGPPASGVGPRNIVLVADLSTEPDAVDIEASFPFLDMGGLRTVLGVITAANGQRQNDIATFGVGTPWMRVGDWITITDVPELGGGPAYMVYDCTGTYTEKRGESATTNNIKGVSWG